MKTKFRILLALILSSFFVLSIPSTIFANESMQDSECIVKFTNPAKKIENFKVTREFSNLNTTMDISGPVGSPILSAADGKVIFAGWGDGAGFTVRIKHRCGLMTVYEHGKKQPLVKAGDQVTRGQKIMKLGFTGSTTSPILGFGLKKKDSSGLYQFINPRTYVNF